MLKKAWLLGAALWAQQSMALMGSDGGMTPGSAQILGGNALSGLLGGGLGESQRRFGYAYSPQVSADVREQVMNELIAHGYRRGVMNSDREYELRHTLGQTDLIAAVERELRNYGYEPRDLATAITYWLMVNYGIIHGITTGETENHAVLRQARHLLATRGDMGRLSDAEKQRVAEAMYWFATLQQFAYEQARQGMPGYDLNEVVADAHATLMMYGIDAYQLRLTHNGLELR